MSIGFSKINFFFLFYAEFNKNPEWLSPFFILPLKIRSIYSIINKLLLYLIN